MEIIKVGIRVHDREFAEALARGIALQSRKILISVRVENDDSDDLILTDDLPAEKREIYLSENREEDILLQEMPYSVYRYLNSRKMTDVLYYAYYSLTGKILSGPENRKCHLITGLSLSGGIWTTTVLLSIAAYFSLNYGKKCLYFSLCPANTIYTEEGHKGCFMKMIYYLQDRRDFPIGIFISKSENVDYLAAEILNPSYTESDKELLQLLLDKLNSDGVYDFLFLDTGNHVSYSTVEMVSLSEAVLFFHREKEKGTGGFMENFREVNLLEVITGGREDLMLKENQLAVKEHGNTDLQGEYEKEISKIAEWIGGKTGNGK